MKKLIDCLKIGDEVFDICYGWGVRVEPLCNEGQILVRFKEGFTIDYTPDGKLEESDVNPSLFLEEIKLEQNLPDFVEGEIVLVNTDYSGLPYEENNWMVAVYAGKEENGLHRAKLCTINSFARQTEVFKDVKSFDKSHFIK